MEGEGGVTRSIIHEIHSLDIQEDQMEGESGAIQSILDEFHSSDMQRDQMEGKGDVTGSIIDELHFSDLVKWKLQVMLLEVPLMNFILVICKEFKWN